MENNVVNNTEPQQLHQSLSKKIGKHLRATHYKLGLDGISYYLYLSHIYITNKYRLVT